MAENTNATVRKGVPAPRDVVAFLNEACDGWGTEDYFRWKYEKYPDYSPHDHTFHITVDGELAAFRRVFRKELRANGDRVPVYVLGDTAVGPDHRGQGLYSRLHARTMEFSRRSDAANAITYNRKGNVTFDANRDRGWRFVELPLQLRILSPEAVLRSYADRLLGTDSRLGRALEVVGDRLHVDVPDGRVRLAELVGSSARPATGRRSLGVGLTDRALARLVETVSTTDGVAPLGTAGIGLLFRGDVVPFREPSDRYESLTQTYQSLRLTLQNDQQIISRDDLSSREVEEICELYETHGRSNRSFRRDPTDVRHLLRFPGSETFLIERDDELSGFAVLGPLRNGAVSEGHVLEIVTKRRSDYQPLLAAIERRAIELGLDLVLVVSERDLGDYWARIDQQVVMWKPLREVGGARRAVDPSGISLYDVV